MNLEKEILKVLPDFYEYYLKSDIEEFDNKEDFIIYTIEHEIDIYINCNYEYKEQVSYINKTNLQKIKRIISKYYKNVNKGTRL